LHNGAKQSFAVARAQAELGHEERERNLAAAQSCAPAVLVRHCFPAGIDGGFVDLLLFPAAGAGR